jgi:FG-GAP-like repeat
MIVRPARFLIAAILLASPALVPAQWISFSDLTSTFLSFPGYAADDSEKDFQVADLNNDGLLDLVIVRKQAWMDGPRTHVLLMNVNGVLTDQTATYASGFLANPSLARTSVIGDFDNDGWKDVIVGNANSFNPPGTNYQTQYYKNLGSSGGSWLGLQLASGHVPVFTPPANFASSAIGDVDADGDLDLFLGSFFSQGLGDRICINDGTGHFTDQTLTRFPTGNNASTYSTKVQMADLEPDGDLDIVESDNGTMKGHINDGSGVFSTLTGNPATSTTYAPAVADLNNDGRPDIYQGRDGQDAYSINTTPPGGSSASRRRSW